MSTVHAKTAYHVLKRLSAKPNDPNAVGGNTFQLVRENLEAASAEAAIRQYASKESGTVAGAFVAVLSRSFVEKTVKVETQTVVKLA